RAGSSGQPGDERGDGAAALTGVGVERGRRLSAARPAADDEHQGEERSREARGGWRALDFARASGRALLATSGSGRCAGATGAFSGRASAAGRARLTGGTRRAPSPARAGSACRTGGT